MKLSEYKTGKLNKAIAAALYALDDHDYLSVEVWDVSAASFVIDEAFSCASDAAKFMDKMLDVYASNKMFSLWTIDYTNARFTFVVNADWALGWF